jgi:hypothetical protein
VPDNLLVPDGQLEAEGDRLAMNPMRPPDHHGVAMFHRAALERFSETIDAFANETHRLLHLDSQRRVDNVGRGQSHVEEPMFRTYIVGQRLKKGDHVVFRY